LVFDLAGLQVFAGLRVMLYDSNWMGVCELGWAVRDSQALGDESKYLQATAGIHSYLCSDERSGIKKGELYFVLN
jgi:hypothetical protein